MNYSFSMQIPSNFLELRRSSGIAGEGVNLIKTRFELFINCFREP